MTGREPELLRCPEGDLDLEVFPETQDDDLLAFWQHICTHSGDEVERLRLWNASMAATGDEARTP